ncbi:hypothetical protein NX02_05865 [Sphingomonas sanxanigenens DSM 19645 = NX02]|uniref:Uncharacterized protein n=1 Tax=Sphingomonas sanxanigenens DSM 19645 = NX02 TaxID=1123269 RepID=W0A990_9SPHN|nr:hypothetical protein NX02_05865 [Sphingomonas sanxanigenens DSM 19645 = NX02]
MKCCGFDEMNGPRGRSTMFAGGGGVCGKGEA